MKMLLIVQLLLGLSGLNAAQEAGPCIAFIRYGSLVLDCPGETHQGKDLNIQGFGISESGELGVMRSVPGPITDGGSKLVNESLLVNLARQAQKPFAFYPDAFTATCGLLLAEAPKREGIVDASTGLPATQLPYRLYRCSKNRDVVLGQITKSEDLRLQQDSKVATLDGTAGITAFDVSPNGEYLAYSTGKEICVQRIRSAASCTPVTTVGRLSISNSGDVAFAMGTNENCVYEDTWHFRPAPGSSSDKHQDQCLDVMLWHPGLKSPTDVALGRDPQWVAKEWVGGLKKWLSETPNPQDKSK